MRMLRPSYLLQLNSKSQQRIYNYTTTRQSARHGEKLLGLAQMMQVVGTNQVAFVCSLSKSKGNLIIKAALGAPMRQRQCLVALLCCIIAAAHTDLVLGKKLKGAHAHQKQSHP